jgi:hypothetical protein
MRFANYYARYLFYELNLNQYGLSLDDDTTLVNIFHPRARILEQSMGAGNREE